MHTYTLRCEMLVKSSLQETFAIFEDPYNLAKITPPSLNFKVTSTDRVEMRKGAEINYTIQWMRVPLHWTTIIREYEPPFFFVDEQAKGPYRLWRHRHTFEPAQSGTKVADHVEYALPLGPLGTLAHAFLVRSQLLGIFNYRQEQLGKIFDNKAVQTVKPYITP